MTQNTQAVIRGSKRKTEEFFYEPKSGGSMVVLTIITIIVAIGLFIFAGFRLEAREYLIGVPCIIGAILTMGCFVLQLPGYFIVNPNTSRVLVLFGRYIGSVNRNGFYWVNPFTMKHKISLRIRNYDGGKLKVNDSNGNPIEISAVVVWRVRNTAEALFDVDDYNQFVQVQSESALRQLAAHYPYDSPDDDQPSLRGNAQEVGERLKERLEEQLVDAGVEVIDARLNHLAYSPEIAAAMLQRQQAAAIIAARKQIVDGAVGMVEMALRKLRDEKILELDDERKAAMVSNLLVVLCSEHATAPVINAGTLYT